MQGRKERMERTESTEKTAPLELLERQVQRLNFKLLVLSNFLVFLLIEISTTKYRLTIRATFIQIENVFLKDLLELPDKTGRMEEMERLARLVHRVTC
jgi:hypothetical protein